MFENPGGRESPRVRIDVEHAECVRRRALRRCSARAQRWFLAIRHVPGAVLTEMNDLLALLGVVSLLLSNREAAPHPLPLLHAQAMP